MTDDLLAMTNCRYTPAQIDQARKLVNKWSDGSAMTGAYVLVRGPASGVFAGELVSNESSTVYTLRNARRIWYWDGAASLSELAVSGAANPDNCKFPTCVPTLTVLDVCEYHECTTLGQMCLRFVPVWAAWPDARDEEQDLEVSPDFVIVRGATSGVFAGTLEGRDGTTVTLKDARRIWYWDGAASLSEMAVRGPFRPENCKFPVAVKRTRVTDACEILSCTTIAQKRISEVPVWSAK